MSKNDNLTQMEKIQVKAQALEIAMQIMDFYKRNDLTRPAQNGSDAVLKPDNTVFLYSTAQEVEEYLKGNYSPSYFWPKQ